MNWLTPLCQDIVRDKRFTKDQRDTAVLWAGELSALCDRWAPRAPIPQLDLDQNEEDPALMLCWFWVAKQRSLSLYIEEDLAVSVHMSDADRNHIDIKPNHEQLKRAVQCFFEGWEPAHVAS